MEKSSDNKNSGYLDMLQKEHNQYESKLRQLQDKIKNLNALNSSSHEFGLNVFKR